MRRNDYEYGVDAAYCVCSRGSGGCYAPTVFDSHISLTVRAVSCKNSDYPGTTIVRPQIAYDF